MKAKTLLYSFLTISFIALSCDGNNKIYDEDDIEENAEILEVTHTELMSLTGEIPLMEPKDAVSCVESFIKSHFPLVKSNDLIIEVKGQFYIDRVSHEKSQVALKSGEDDYVTFFEVEIDNAGELNSALVCGNGRFPGVVAYVKSGISDSGRTEFQDNPMLELSERTAMFNIQQYEWQKDSIKSKLLERIGEICNKKPQDITLSDIEKTVKIIGSNGTKSQRFMIWEIEGVEIKRQNPMLYVSWNQDAPYNRKLEQICTYDWFYEGRPPVGCTAVAIASVISHFQPPMMASGLTVNWPLIKQSRSVYTSASTERIRQISTYMKWVADNIGSEYDCEDTSAPMDPAVAFMANYNIYSNSKSGMDVSKILNSIEYNQRIVLISAFREGGKGHAWVLDGFIRTNFNSQVRNYIWANLCWGGTADGLYLADSNTQLTFEVSPDRHYDRTFSIYPNIRRQ